MSDQQSPDAARQLAVDLAQARPMRRGSLSERYMKCGQTTCRCQQDPDARHGPYFSLTRGAGGTTHSRYLSEEQAKLARVQIEAGQKFRKQVDAFWQACEAWGDAQLDATQAASQEAAKKGGSKKHSTRKSRRKSKRS
jgi:hypothetical protein